MSAVAACRWVAALGAIAHLQTAAAASQPTVPEYVRTLRGVAVQLRAAAREHGPQAVPTVRIPPAPFPGPPRFSPSLDNWLQTALNDLHDTRWVRDRQRAVALRRIADALDEAAVQTRRAASDRVAIARDPRATAAAILARQEYRHAPPTAAAAADAPWWLRLMNWIGERLNQLLKGLFYASSRTGANWVVLAAVLGGLALAIGLAVVRLSRYLLARPRRSATFDDGDPLPPPPDADALLDAARSAALRGDFRRAATALFRAAIALLDRAQRVPLDPARTAGEYRRMVRRSVEPAATAFDAIATTFTLAAYAERPVSAPEWRAAADAYERFAAALVPQAR